MLRIRPAALISSKARRAFSVCYGLNQSNSVQSKPIDQHPTHHQNELSKLLEKVINVTGPISLSAYMRQCLTNPDFGYYTTRDPLGAQGDFVTSPEISQIFGELIGVWYLKVWLEQGKPKDINFIEFGPGKGTLISDILRSFSLVLKRLEMSDEVKIKIVLIEASPVLKQIQHSLLTSAAELDKTGTFWTSKHNWDGEIVWVDTEKDVFDVTKESDTNFIMAHEFFDALPVNKFQKTDEGWKEILVDVNQESRKLYFMESKPNVPSTAIAKTSERYDSVPVGATIEVSPELYTYTKDISRLVTRNQSDTGAALIIDYGLSNQIPSDTLRGIRDHKFVSPLEDPGEVDLSTDVDFEAIATTAKEASPIKTLGPSNQGDWLLQMGIQVRAQQLLELAKSREEQDLIISAYHRLVDKDGDAMGKAYKFLALLPRDSNVQDEHSGFQ